MAGQREQIRHQIELISRSGQQSPIRLLLNQSHAENIARHFRYYEFIVAARRHEMRFFLDGLQQKRSLEARLLQSMQDLQATETIAEEEKGRLLSLQDERRQLLVATNAELDTKHDALQQLERDRVALQKVIEQIERQRSLAQAVEKEREEKQGQKTLVQAPLLEAQHVNKPDDAASQPPSLYSAEDLARLQTTAFKKRKGALPWPVNGSIAHRFGEQRQGNVSWDGLRIRAAAGVDVRAVHYGRVVYADWLRGQGMLVILDHGDGFMSLYAHNDVLLHGQGEWVKAGDVIARVGNSGGEKEAGLYFEIRQSGKTVDPQLWLGKK